jgi:hypothetical protein
MSVGKKREWRLAVVAKRPFERLSCGSRARGERFGAASANVFELPTAVTVDGDTGAMLRRLEAENATLRHRAIHLALEIQYLNQDRERN